ncbi:MAG: T9SS type A sorting domain-containing protein [Candidatus Electryonea clarkiae]|nr:T9SS type A sorting domain-containing protein [Candidatus Electryonea clarkiae]MDP8285220.1 T9SS type A sorting domain-containing protein [Candidatus Electryonea clarkiae]
MRHFLQIILPIILFSCLGVLHAQDSLNISLISSLSDSWPRFNDIAISGDYAYISTPYNGIYIYDISDPTEPEKIGSYPISVYCNELEIVDSLLYLVSSPHDDGQTLAGLYIFDISNTPELELISRSSAYGLFVSVDGNLLASGSWNSYQVHDISDPENPLGLGTFSSNNVQFGGVYLLDTLLYLPARSDMRIVNVANPEEPLEIGILDIDGGAYDLAIKDDLAFVANGDSGLAIIDISDPSNPSLSSQTGFGWKITAIDVFGDYAYLTAIDDNDDLNTTYSIGIIIVDISDVNSPSYVGLIPSGTAQVKKHHMIIQGDTIYFTERYSGLRIYNISDPTSPEEIGYNASPNSGKQIEVSDDILYTLISNTLWTIDYSDPSQPEVLNYLRFHYHYYVYQMELINDKLIFTTSNNALLQVDISEPYTPVMLDTIPFPRNRLSRMHAIDDNTLFITADTTIYIVNMPNEDNDSVIDSINYPGGRFSDLTSSGNYLYIFAISDSTSLYTYDVSSPASPELILALTLPYYGYSPDLQILQDDLFILVAPTILKIDISSHELPQYVGRFYLPDYMTDISAIMPWGPYLAFTQDYPSTILYISDLSGNEDSTTARTVAYYRDEFHYFSPDMAQMGSYLITTGDGIHTFEPSQDLGISLDGITSFKPEEFSVGPFYPNPTNSTISFNLSIASPGITHFSITNILGKKVTKFQRWYPVGKHHVSMKFDDIQSISSGRYFITTQHKQKVSSYPIILLK